MFESDRSNNYMNCGNHDGNFNYDNDGKLIEFVHLPNFTELPLNSNESSFAMPNGMVSTNDSPSLYLATRGITKRAIN